MLPWLLSPLKKLPLTITIEEVVVLLASDKEPTVAVAMVHGCAQAGH